MYILHVVALAIADFIDGAKHFNESNDRSFFTHKYIQSIEDFEKIVIKYENESVANITY